MGAGFPACMAGAAGRPPFACCLLPLESCSPDGGATPAPAYADASAAAKRSPSAAPVGRVGAKVCETLELVVVVWTIVVKLEA
jgi:hypothetical protein